MNNFNTAVAAVSLGLLTQNCELPDHLEVVQETKAPKFKTKAQAKYPSFMYDEWIMPKGTSRGPGIVRCTANYLVVNQTDSGIAYAVDRFEHKVFNEKKTIVLIDKYTPQIHRYQVRDTVLAWSWRTKWDDNWSIEELYPLKNKPKPKRKAKIPSGVHYSEL